MCALPTINHNELISDNESTRDTVHSDQENLVNGLRFVNDRLNVAKNQLIIEKHDAETSVEIIKLFDAAKK